MGEYTFKSSSDCEVLIPLYRKYGLDTLVRYLDGEYAFCLYDADADKMMAEDHAMYEKFLKKAK